jgi:hypothetical protein
MATIKLDFKLSSWEKVRPKEIKGAKFSAALKEVEKAQAGMKKKGDASANDDCVDAMNAVADAAQELMKKECDAKKHKDLITGLKKFNTECKAEIKKLQDAKAKAGDDDDDDDDLSDDDMFGIKLFKECIKKAKLKSSTEDGVSFCLGIHKDALESKLVLMKKKKFANQIFKRVLKVAKKQPELGLKRPKMTYGAAYRDPDSKETLVLHIIDGAPTEIPGMVRKLEKWRKKFKQDILPFKELSIRTPSGKPLEVTPDPDEEEQAQAAATADEEQEEEVQTAAGTAAAPEPAAQEQAQAATAAAAEQQAEEEEEEEILAAEAPDATSGDAAEDRRKEFRKARRTWQTVKEQAIQDIEAVKDGIRDYYLDDPEQFKLATGKLNQLDTIMDNLNDDLRDVLDNYVSTPRNRQSELQRLGADATDIVQRFLQYANSDKLLNAVDQKEFADVTVKAPIEKALKDLVKTLG